MEPILPVDKQMAAFDNERLLELIKHPSSTIRARALPTLGARVADFPLVTESILSAAADPENPELIFYAFIKVAWVAAITPLDYGHGEDFIRLRNIVGQWPHAEREGFLSYIKDYRDFDRFFQPAAIAS